MIIETKVKCPHCGKELNLENIFSQQSDIYNLIKKLMAEEGDNNFMVIEIDSDYYIQVMAAKDLEEFTFEAVSNTFLAASKKLTENQQSKMISLGWNAPDKFSENYHFEVGFKVDKELIEAIELITKTAKEIYGAKHISHKMIKIIFE